MNQGIEIISPSSYLRNSNWLFEESKGTKWTPEENKQFENALALFDKDTPDRWYNVAAMVPGKTVRDVIKQYRELEEDVSNIEAGLIPIPGYNSGTFMLEWENNPGCDGFKQLYSPGGKRSSSTRALDQERKKGVPWSEEEHRQFLLGLKKYGKGDWRNISRNFVTTRTPTQVASHAQKYFIRQLSGGKDKKRSSIHDITTFNLTDNKSPSPDNNRLPSPDQCSTVTQLHQHSNGNGMNRKTYNWDPPKQGAAMAFNLPSSSSSLFRATHCGTSSYGFELQEQTLQKGSVHGLQFGTYNTGFYMYSSQHQ